ncbi:MAG: DUF2029 domain-containing protein, partial [Candidatus Eremiobacteraeota bacterium]|nr:DUF2029 domain-containing protein [Candidatus Eremiobacteraeota bacterium]MBV9407855.1 DUF2029 domain-containing protein [Candidatus Eremiobacteraeota bacterium]
MWRVERTVAGVDPSRDELLPYVGPAAALPLFGALARLPQPVAVRVWCGLLAAAFGALIVAALRLARTYRVTALLGAMLLGVAAGPTTSDFALGQVALLSAAGLACALLAYDRTRLFTGAFATLLTGVQPNLAIALLARMRDVTARRSAGLGGAAFGLLTLVAGGGFTSFVRYLHRLGEHGRAERFVTIQHTPGAIAWSFGAPEGLASAVTVACALATVAAVVVVTVRARLNPLDGTLLALAALPLAIPFFHEHDFVVELIPLVILAVRASGTARAWAGVAAVLILVDWLGLAQRTPAQFQIVALAVGLACAFVVAGRGARATRAD